MFPSKELKDDQSGAWEHDSMTVSSYCKGASQGLQGVRLAWIFSVCFSK